MAFFLSQAKYVKDLLHRTRMLESSAINTLMILKDKPSSSNNDLVGTTTFISLIDALQYLNFTRPNISHVVNKVCQHFNEPKFVHLKATKRILRYIMGVGGLPPRVLPQIKNPWFVQGKQIIHLDPFV